MSTERIIVVKSIASKFRSALLTAASSMTGMSGPNVMSSTVTKVQSLVSDALSKGAVLEFGQNKLASGQQHLHQMLVGNVSPGMDIYHTETFGPVSTLIEVEDVEEAIRVANDTEYGLSAAVFSRDLSLAIQVAKRIESGAVHINGNTVHDENCLPHGGESPNPPNPFSFPLSGFLLDVVLLDFGWDDIDFRMEEVWVWEVWK
jgi:acyl-CoA reductase-like NAD-dependent aldehyde dehydrogenase